MTEQGSTLHDLAALTRQLLAQLVTAESHAGTDSAHDDCQAVYTTSEQMARIVYALPAGHYAPAMLAIATTAAAQLDGDKPTAAIPPQHATTTEPEQDRCDGCGALFNDPHFPRSCAFCGLIRSTR